VRILLDECLPKDLKHEITGHQAAKEYAMLDTEAISQLINCDPEIMGGTPVFRGTRVPVYSLLAWLKGGYTIGEFLENFPTVERGQAEAIIDLANEFLVSSAK
jgi:uncharacterized protein (DUF433 family)